MKQRGHTLVGTLAVIAILGILIGGYYMGGFGAKNSKDGEPKTVVGQVKRQADKTVVQSNLRQIRTAIEMHRQMNEDAYPPTLDELRLPKEITTDPNTDQPFAYDPATGAVRSTVQGYEEL